MCSHATSVVSQQGNLLPPYPRGNEDQEEQGSELHEASKLCYPKYQSQGQDPDPVFLIRGQREKQNKNKKNRTYKVITDTWTNTYSKGIADSRHVLLNAWVGSARSGFGDVSSGLLMQAGVL